MGFMMQIRPEVLRKLREDYPSGCRVELVQMFEEPRKDMVPGLTGEVMFVDDAGGIHIHFEAVRLLELRQFSDDLPVLRLCGGCCPPCFCFGEAKHGYKMIPERFPEQHPHAHGHTGVFHIRHSP